MRWCACAWPESKPRLNIKRLPTAAGRLAGGGRFAALRDEREKPTGHFHPGFRQIGTIPQGFRMKDGHYEDICPYYHEL